MKFSNRTLVIAAHPDDEVLGCGATMAKIAAEGGEVQSLFVSDGESSRYEMEDVKTKEVVARIDSRRISAQKAASILGSLPPRFLDYPDNRLDHFSLLDITKKIEFEILNFRPSRIITHFAGDLNIDHRKVCEAVLVATRPQAGLSVEELWCYEVPSSTEWGISGINMNFVPNIFVNVDGFDVQKMAALNAYHNEMREYPHPRSKVAIESLMNWRGATSHQMKAEAFMLIRAIR